MPIVTGSGGATSAITVEIQGKIDDLLTKVNQVDKSLDQFSAANREASKQAEIAAKNSSMSWTDFRSMYSTVLDVIRVGQQVWQQTAGVTLEYDAAVRQLAEISGTGAEESSRLLQVLDDFKITSGDVTAATRALTKQGLSPTIDTLAQLSDQYNKLNPGQERAAFLMENFGRSGMRFGEVMSKGGDALRQMGTEVEKSLIRTDAQIAKTRLAELAFDSWADKVEGIKVTIGSGLIGAVDGSTLAITRNAQEIFKAAEGYSYSTNRTGQYTQAQRDAWAEAEKLATEQYLLANGMDITTEASDNLTMSLEEQIAADEEAAKAASELYTSVLSGAESAYKSQTTFNETIVDLKQKQADVKAEMEKLLPWQTEKVNELKKKYDEYGNKIKETQETHRLAMGKIQYDLLMTKLATGGLTEEEFRMGVEAGIAFGIFDQEAADAMIAQNELTEAVADGKITVEQYGKGMKAAMEDGIVSSQELNNMLSQVKDNSEITITMDTTPAVTELQNLHDYWNSEKQYYTTPVPVYVYLPPPPDYGCFIGGTLISMGNGTKKAIENVKVGDIVYSLDTNTNNLICTKIAEIFHHKPEETPFYLLINGNLGVTPEHLMFINSEWKPALEIKSGDSLIDKTGFPVRVKTVEYIDENVAVYNLHTDHETHNYFAGGVLVHNTKAEGGPVGEHRSYLVGERGPELFIPKTNGTIIPNDALRLEDNKTSSSSLTQESITYNYYNAQITNYTGEIDPKKTIRSLI